MADLGYESQTYGQSFRDFGEIVTLPRSRLQVIRRPLDGHEFDLAGLYPFSTCRDWRRLVEDVDFMRTLGGVSIVLVADPTAEQAAREALSHWTTCAHFKTQFVVSLEEDWRGLRAKNVRNSVNQALKMQTLEVVESPEEHAETFWALYRQTNQRHSVSGIQRLSLAAITAQLGVEGAVMVVARQEGAVCGALISYDQGDEGYLHLLGQSYDSYAIKTSYALIHGSLEALESRGCKRVSLGGPAGLSDDPEDGLYQFKSRWTRHRRATLLCGQVLDPRRYESLVARSGCQPGRFFPAYRTPGGGLEWRPESLDAVRGDLSNPSGSL